jgi:hypothetical protein
MATRLYFDNVALPVATWNGSSYAVPPISSSWTGADDHGNGQSGGITAEARRLVVTRSSTTLTPIVRTFDSADHLVAGNALSRRYVSDPLTAQSIPAQTVSLQIQGSELRAADDQFLTWKLFLVDSAGAAVASGTLVSLRVDGTEFTTTLTNRGDSLTSTSVSAPLNSRLCLEIGSSGTPSLAVQINGHNTTLQFGDAGTGDLPVDDTTTGSTLRPWLNLATTTLSFVPVNVPALRLTQDTFEGLYDDGTTGVGTLRFTQDTFEGLIAVGGGADAELHFTQDTFEGLYDEVPVNIPRIFVTQDTIEGLWDEGDAPPPEEEQPTSCPEGLVQTSRSVAGQITVTAPDAGLIGWTMAAKGQIGCD